MHVCNFITTQIRDKHCKYYCRHSENKRQSIRIVTRGGTSAEGTGGSIHTSWHSVLREVADHNRCRKMFAMQSREHPPGRRRSSRSRSVGVEEDDLAGEQSRKTLPKNLIARTPEQVYRCKASGSGGQLSRSLCAQRSRTEMDREQLDSREWRLTDWVVSQVRKECLRMEYIGPRRKRLVSN